MTTKRASTVVLIANLVVLLLLSVHLTSAQTRKTSDVLRGRALEIVDASGKVRCRINVEASGEVVFRLVDPKGAIRVKAGADAGGSGLLLLDGLTEPAIHMVARREADAVRKATSITLNGASGAQRVLTP